MAHQLDDLRRDLSGYEGLGRARELGGGGEFVPLLFLRNRFDADQWGVFWLSETPDVEGSMGWDADNPRISTWAVLRDRETSRAFLVINTHLDRWGTLAREASAELLVSRASRFAGVPLLVIGDLNVTEDDTTFAALQAGLLRDSYRDLYEGPAPPTIHHYGERFGGKIDFVLCDPNWRTLGAEIVTDRPLGRWPSDHYPVMADLELIEDRSM